MCGRCDNTDTFKEPASRRFRKDYWTTRLDGRLLSSDKSIDPPGVKTIDPPPGVSWDVRRPAKRCRRARFQRESQTMLMMPSCRWPVWETRSVFQP
jgi:hypothetical protein